MVGEKYWVSKLVGELNRELNLGLAMTVSGGWTLSAAQGKQAKCETGRMVLVGASNAERTATALKKSGTEVLKVTRPGWAVTKDNVEAVCVEVESERLDKDTIVIQCLDNSTFYLVDEETGSMTLPVKGDKGIYHVTGKIVVTKDMQLELMLSRLEVLLKRRPEDLKVLVCPLPRFLEDCCKEHERSEDEKKEDGGRQLKELWEMRRSIKTFLVKKKLQNVVMVDPLAVLEVGKDVMEVRKVMADNYHLKAKHVVQLAARIRETVVSWQQGGKRKAEEKLATDSKKIRLGSEGQTSGNGRAAQGGRGGGLAKGGYKPTRGHRGRRY